MSPSPDRSQSVDLAAAPVVSLDHYQLRLEAFEGPLDVLLRLIERERLAIADVSLVAVTDGFLAYLRDLNDPPPPLLAEFVAVAGRLLVLKSRSLLPRPSAAPEEPEPGELARQLAEHRALRDAARALGELDRLGLGSFPIGAGVQRPTTPAVHLTRQAPGSLVSAIRRRLAAAAETPRPMSPPPRVVTLAEMATRFFACFRQASSIRFDDVLSPGAGREEALTGFLALLILIRRKVARASQADLFGAIEIQLTDSPSSPELADLLVQQDTAGAPG
ncbi:MAG TPA: ScpA family protein [Thermomicrobiales bacterium]|nr:ScpA family protein [Thermomicrobiales bacterium]